VTCAGGPNTICNLSSRPKEFEGPKSTDYQKFLVLA
jgi:hypothetical protein